MEDPIIENVEVEEEDVGRVKVGFKLEDNETEFPGAGGDEEQGGNSEDVIYLWHAKEIDIANNLSSSPERDILNCMEWPTREAMRTHMDNEIDMIAYLNNKENWNVVYSRMCLFIGSLLAIIALVSLIITSSEEAAEENISFYQFISNARSVSGIYRLRDGAPSAANQIFSAFLTATSILMVVSNFGFYVMPRWETHSTIMASDTRGGDIAHRTMRLCMCRTNFRRIEATSNWVTGEEGIFKIAYNLVAGICIALISSVPTPPEGEAQAVYMAKVHTTVAILTFVISIFCEIYQLFRGEKMYKRCTGMVQIMRLICVIFGIIGILGYVILQGKPKGSDGAALCVIFEWFGFLFLILIFLCYCFVPIKASQSVFALSGDQYKKETRLQSMYTHIGKND